MNDIVVTVIAADISGVVTLVVCMVNNHYQASSTRSLIEYKLDELTKRVDLHNGVIERVYNLEKSRDVFEEKLRDANHRIDDLEKARE